MTQRLRGCGSQRFSVWGSLALEPRPLPRFCTLPGARIVCLPFCGALALSQLLCAAKKTAPPPGTTAEALSDPGMVMGIWVWSFGASEQPLIIQHLPPYMTLELLSGATGAIDGKEHNWERADAPSSLPNPALSNLGRPCAGRVLWNSWGRP